MDRELNKSECEILLQIAKKAIVSKSSLTDSWFDVESDSALNDLCGVFVSVYIDAKLRGCIGRFKSDKPLYKLVALMAFQSAFHDSRFEPIDAEELDSLEIELSVISPFRTITSIDEFELGKHGIYIKQGFNSGTFLPQVAEKTGWSAEEFFGHCSRDKAGIGWDGWKTAELQVYTADVFRSGERNLNTE